MNGLDQHHHSDMVRYRQLLCSAENNKTGLHLISTPAPHSYDNVPLQINALLYIMKVLKYSSWEYCLDLAM